VIQEKGREGQNRWVSRRKNLVAGEAGKDGRKERGAGMSHTFFTLMVLPLLHSFEGCGTGNEFVRELGLVFVAARAVDLLVGITSFIEAEHGCLNGLDGDSVCNNCLLVLGISMWWYSWRMLEEERVNLR